MGVWSLRGENWSPMDTGRSAGRGDCLLGSCPCPCTDWSLGDGVCSEDSSAARDAFFLLLAFGRLWADLRFAHLRGLFRAAFRAAQSALRHLGTVSFSGDAAVRALPRGEYLLR